MPKNVEHLKFAQNASGDTINMYLYSSIGGDKGISGQMFANELDLLVSAGYKKILVHINSAGGNILEGWSILSSILNINRGKNGVAVDTCNDGLAGSIAGIILMAGKKVMMLDWAKIMIHNPSYGKSEDQMSENEKKSLMEFKNSLVNIFRSRAKKSTEEIEEMMNQETWLNAEQALDGGFIDEIISTSKLKRSDALNVLCEATNELKSTDYAHALYKQIIEEYNNEKTTPNKIGNTMPDINFSSILNDLGIDKDANESQIKDKISVLRAEAVTGKALQNEIDILRAENQRLQAQVQETKKVQCENLVDEAIKDNKLRPSQKAEWLEIAMMSFDTAKKAIDAMNGHPQLSQLTQKTGDERADWDWTKWAQNDSVGLMKLKEEDRGLYSILYKNYYGMTPKIED